MMVTMEGSSTYNVSDLYEITGPVNADCRNISKL